MNQDFITADTRQLQRCINDLVGVLALPAMWIGGAPSKIADSLLDSLLEMLDLDFVYLRLHDPVGNAPAEATRTAGSYGLSARPEEIAAWLEPWIGQDPQNWPPRIAIGPDEMSIVPLRLGLQGEIGLLAAGSRRDGFPQQTERLVLGVAANQAAIGLLGARSLIEGTLAASERKLDRTINAIPAMAWSADTDGNVDFFNQNFLDYVGVPTGQMQHGGWTDAVHPDDLERLLATWKSIMAFGRGGETEARLRRFDGAYRWFLMRVSPFYDEAAKVIKWYGVNTDIEDWRRTEEALRAREFLLHAMIEGIGAPMSISNPRGEMEAANRLLLDYAGQTIEEMRNWRGNNIIHPDDRERAIEGWQRAIETGQTFELESRRRRADGVYRYWHSHLFPVRDADARIVHWCVLHVDVHDRKQAEESLRASELMLNSMVDSVAAPLGFFKPTGKLEVVNRLVLDYFGTTLEAVSKWENIVHPADLAASRAAWNRSLETGEAYEHEARLRRADGTYRWNDHRGYPMRDADGEIVRWCVLQIDIHDRKQAEARLAASERNLDQIINTIPGLAWTADPDGNAEFLNQHYLEYIGSSLDQARGAGWVAAVHPDDLEHLIADWRAMMAARRAGESEARLRRHDGEYRWFLFRASPVLDDAGNVVRWFGANTDIEGRRRAEEALRASELNLRQLTETIPQMLWSATADGAIDYCNKRLLEFTGFTAEEAMGTGWAKMIHPDDVESAIKAWRASITTGDPYNVEVRTLHASDGTHRWLLTSALPLRDADGRILKWHGACADMNDWKQAQDELRNTQAELAHMTRVMTMGHLTASIAHELNQPLAGIITNASTCMRMLAADPPNVTGARETARRTIRDGNRAAEVITRLRALFSKKNTAIEAVDLNTATQEVIALTLTELQRASVTLRVDLADEIPFVKGDRVQLQQVIMNLILNAVEAMDGVTGRPKELIVATQCGQADHVRVVVQDVGVGLDTASTEKLFHPFYTTKSHGMGIGLSVSRSIVENHQGQLWAESNEGPGATFLVSIPCWPDRDGAVVSA